MPEFCGGATQAITHPTDIRERLEALPYRMEFGLIAHDGFESGNYSSGSGWTGGWTTSGDLSILTAEGPHAGKGHCAAPLPMAL
jgi:hypothetical protein